MNGHRNLFPRTVIALTLAGIDPTDVAVTGLSTSGYRTFTFNTVEEQGFAQKEPILHRGKIVLDENEQPVLEFHQWPSDKVADDVWSAYVADVVHNQETWAKVQEESE